MAGGSTTKKKAINVSIDSALVAEAKAAGLNVSGVLESALLRELKAPREVTWREQNKAAIDKSNAELARNGLW